MWQDGSREGALIVEPEELNQRTLHARRGTGGCLSVVIDPERISSFRSPAATTTSMGTSALG